MTPSARNEVIRVVVEFVVGLMAVAAFVVSVVSVIRSTDTAQDVGNRDRTLTFDTEILVPANARFVTALDAFERQANADLSRVRADPTTNTSMGLDATNYDRLLDAIRSAKAQVDLVAPATLALEASRANTLYGTEASCLQRLVRGDAAENFAVEKQHRDDALATMQSLRERYTNDARQLLAINTTAPSLDSLSPAPDTTPPAC